ncbi:unnamed protein product [Paramecium sonneborni]|uniref:Uncharacterized protein n=1 Tax=Paramecium sonneborni TaxID=65129 RepID=A0A8S1QX52_9CILI|nr:unnamed protein product [Paramecium sonneborni]
MLVFVIFYFFDLIIFYLQSLSIVSSTLVIEFKQIGYFSYLGQNIQINKLQNEIYDLKQKIGFIAREHKQQKQDIQIILGIDIDLDQLFTNSFAEGLWKLKLQKKALQKLESVTILLNEAETMIFKLQKEKELLKKEESKYINAEQQNQMKRIQNQKGFKQKRNQNQNKLNRNKQQSFRDCVTIIIGESLSDRKKSECYYQFTISNISKNSRKKEYKFYCKFEVLKYITDQYEKYLLKENEEIEHFIHQFKKYQEKKKMQIRNMKSESFDLFDILREHLEEELIVLNKIIQYFCQRQTSYQILLAFSHFLIIEVQKIFNMMELKLRLLYSLEHNNIKMNLSEMEEPNLRQFANMIRDELVQVLMREKELQKQVVELEILQLNNDLNTLIKEREENKQLYL